jgi:hypothetical protein
LVSCAALVAAQLLAKAALLMRSIVGFTAESLNTL